MTIRELLTTWGFKVDQKPLEKLDASLSTLKRTVAVVGAATLGAAAALFGLAQKARNSIRLLDDTAGMIGVNVQWLAELSAVAEMSGAGMEEVATGVTVLQRKIVEAKEGNADLVKSFKKLGISVNDLGRLPTEAIMMKMSDGLKAIEKPGERVALAFELFGRGGTRLLPTLVGGSKELANWGDKARQFGLVSGPEAVAASVELDNAMWEAEGALKGLVRTIGTKLMPIVTSVVEKLLAWYRANQAIIESKLEAAVKVLAKAVALAWDVVSTLVAKLWELLEWATDSPAKLRLAKAAIIGLVAAMTVGKVFTFIAGLLQLIVIVKALTLAIMANPIVALIVGIGLAVAAVTALVIYHWDSVKRALANVWAGIKAVWGSVSEWFQANVLAPLGEAWEGFRLAISNLWDSMAATFRSVWQGVADWFNRYVVSPVEKVLKAPGKLGEWIGDKVSAMAESAPAEDSLMANVAAISRSPGRPGSPESGLSADRFSSGLRYNAPLAATMGGRSAQMSIGAINVSVTKTDATAGDIGAEVRRSVRQEWDRIAREAALDVG